jgi:hypothetical protein
MRDKLSNRIAKQLRRIAYKFWLKPIGVVG